METGCRHQTSTKTSNATDHDASRTPLYKTVYINLNDDLKAESECKSTAWREEQREGESLCADTSMLVGHTKKRLVTSDGEILKNRSDSAKF